MDHRTATLPSRTFYSHGEVYGFGQLHRSSPLSKTIRQVSAASRRQIEVNLAISFPSLSRTGPELIANRPDAKTSTSFGAQEKGAVELRKNLAQASTISCFPRKGLSPE